MKAFSEEFKERISELIFEEADRISTQTVFHALTRDANLLLSGGYEDEPIHEWAERFVGIMETGGAEKWEIAALILELLRKLLNDKEIVISIEFLGEKKDPDCRNAVFAEDSITPRIQETYRFENGIGISIVPQKKTRNIVNIGLSPK